MPKVERQCICAFRDLDNDGFILPSGLKVLVEPQSQLADIHTDRAIFGRVEIWGFAEHSASNSLLRETDAIAPEAASGQGSAIGWADG